MAWPDLQSFVAELERRDQLRRVSAEVDPILEQGGLDLFDEQPPVTHPRQRYIRNDVSPRSYDLDLDGQIG